MIDWLLGLINKRQKVLYKENQKLKEENKLLREQLPFQFPKTFTPPHQRPPTPKPIDRSR